MMQSFHLKMGEVLKMGTPSLGGDREGSPQGVGRGRARGDGVPRVREAGCWRTQPPALAFR